MTMEQVGERRGLRTQRWKDHFFGFANASTGWH
jgi:hypothetical protein